MPTRVWSAGMKPHNSIIAPIAMGMRLCPGWQEPAPLHRGAGTGA
jgi:hypothetical protein